MHFLIKLGRRESYSDHGFCDRQGPVQVTDPFTKRSRTFIFMIVFYFFRTIGFVALIILCNKVNSRRNSDCSSFIVVINGANT